MRWQAFITLAMYLIMCISGHKTSNETLTGVTEVGGVVPGYDNSKSEE